MPESILIDVTIVIVLGIGVQWMSWRFRLPSLLLLLIGGFVAGPVLGLLDPQSLQSDWVYAFVSLAVGIILFESGLRFRLAAVRAAGAAVRHLVTVGVLVTWLLGGAAAYYIAGFNTSLSVLIGALLIVTGPTVVTPLLRHVRPKGRIGTVARREGLAIDPVGAVLAVIVLQAVTLLHAPQEAAAEASLASAHVLEGMFLQVFVSLGVSVAAASLLVFVLRRRLVPDFLRNPVMLMTLVAAFVTAETLQREAGLLTAALLGIALANQPYVAVQRVARFKGSLQVLLLGTLFILLSARLELDALQHLGLDTLLFLGALVLVVRPLAVFLSGLGTNLTWEERTFLAGLAPRGVVAAGLAALFSFKLAPVFPEEVQALVPIVFAIVLGTVTIYGLAVAPLARWLDLTAPDPRGLLFVGAGAWVREVARMARALGTSVRLIDANARHVRQAQREGLPAEHVDPRSAPALEALDLSGVDRLLITLPHDEDSARSALHLSEFFETADVFQMATRPADSAEPPFATAEPLRGRPLFGEAAHYGLLAERFAQDHSIKAFPITEELSYEELTTHFDGGFVPLFVVRDGSTLDVVAEEDPFTIHMGDKVVALVDPERLSALEAPWHDPVEAAAPPEAVDEDE